jgi:hypothetical protein
MTDEHSLAEILARYLKIANVFVSVCSTPQANGSPTQSHARIAAKPSRPSWTPSASGPDGTTCDA